MSDLWRIPGYTTVRVLRRGPGGVLAVAVDDVSGGTVAIRYLGDLLLDDDMFRQAFRDEVRALRRIDAPNVVRVLDYVETPRGAAIVMEFVRGGSLLASLATHGPTPTESALAVLKNSLHGLAVAHRAGLVHGDYRPRAVLITTGGECKLVDFGLVPRTGRRAGTLAYRPPTHLATGLPGPAGDLYAASATFVECLTGRTPVAGDDRTAQLPEPVRGLARRGLSVDPTGPATDAGALLEQLETAATRGYGRDWERRGRRQLAGRATRLAARPSHRATRPDPLPDRPTSLRPGDGARLMLSSAAAVAVVVGLVAVTSFGGLDHRGPPTASTPAPRYPTLPGYPPGSPIPPDSATPPGSGLPTGPLPPATAVPGPPPLLLVVLADGDDDDSSGEPRTTVIESPFAAPPATPGPLLAIPAGPSAEPLLAARVGPSGESSLAARVGPSGEPLLAARVGPSGEPLLDVEAGPPSEPLVAVRTGPPTGGPLLDARAGPLLDVRAEAPAAPLSVARATPAGPRVPAPAGPRVAVSAPSPLRIEAAIPAVPPRVLPPLRIEADIPTVRQRSSAAARQRPAPESTTRRAPATRSARGGLAPEVGKIVRRGIGITLGSRADRQDRAERKNRAERKDDGDRKDKSKSRSDRDRGGSKSSKPKISINLRLGG